MSHPLALSCTENKRQVRQKMKLSLVRDGRICIPAVCHCFTRAESLYQVIVR